ncbi:hypothetical protein KJ877_08680 [bacterium]|nr:hypothetical protein [bacterium]MBU1990771.1 hypothetical protein [bacterium]
MSVIFEAQIRINDNSEWFIELRDTVVDRVASCQDLDEFSTKVEDFGADYGGHIDEVQWKKDENVPPHIMDEIRLEMARHQEDIEKNKEK